MTFQRLSADHQRLALFQTQVQFWAYFIASWTMFGVGLVPLGYLIFMPAPPFESKLMAIGLSACFHVFSLCFARGLKQSRRWLAEYYERAGRDDKLNQIRDVIDSIEDSLLRDQSRAEFAKRLLCEVGGTSGHPSFKNVLAQRFLLRR